MKKGQADALTIWVAWQAFCQDDPSHQDPEPPIAESVSWYIVPTC